MRVCAVARAWQGSMAVLAKLLGMDLPVIQAPLVGGHCGRFLEDGRHRRTGIALLPQAVRA